jgi:hypothetical protein
MPEQALPAQATGSVDGSFSSSLRNVKPSGVWRQCRAVRAVTVGCSHEMGISPIFAGMQAQKQNIRNLFILQQ